MNATANPPASLARPVTVPGWECGPCTRCGYVWLSMGETPPPCCAGCNSPRWTRPRLGPAERSEIASRGGNALAAKRRAAKALG